MEFVRDNLCPGMLHFLPGDEFISEAVSNFVVDEKIMARSIRRFPRNVYLRVALNPMNPKNAANAEGKYCTGMAGRFQLSNSIGWGQGML